MESGNKQERTNEADRGSSTSPNSPGASSLSESSSAPGSSSSPDELDFSGAFNAIARAMEQDFVGLPSGQKMPAYQGYLEDFEYKRFCGEGYPLQFDQYVTLYLLAFRNPQVQFLIDHAQTPHYQPFTWGMRVRAFEDALYVTQTIPQSPFARGQKIEYASIFAEPTFKSVPALRRKFGDSLYGDIPERELWDAPLHFVNRYLVEKPQGEEKEPCSEEAPQDETRDANEIEAETLSPEDAGAAGANGIEAGMRIADRSKLARIAPSRLPMPAPQKPFELQEISPGVLVMTLRDSSASNLSGEDAFARFMADSASAISEADELIIDARDCSGGSDETILPLLPHVISEATSLASYMETEMLVNVTEKNVRRKLALYDYLIEAAQRQGLAASEIDGMRSERDAVDKAWKEQPRPGRRLVETSVAPELEQIIAPAAPKETARRVALLTDVNTCGAADLLAEVCHDSERTAVVGRATRGSRGYGDLVAFNCGFCSLQYPTARFTDEGLARHYAGVGVPPDVYVPWTPDHLADDADLRAALSARG